MVKSGIGDEIVDRRITTTASEPIMHVEQTFSFTPAQVASILTRYIRQNHNVSPASPDISFEISDSVVEPRLSAVKITFNGPTRG